MPNYKLTLSFIGTKYAGWQIQPNLPTVQGTLKEVLEIITKEEINIIGCSRTDAGVHALEYVANFKTRKELDIDKILISINSLLPDDIGVKSIEEVDDKFNARFSVKGKRYLYKIWNSKAKDPFLYPFAWTIFQTLDIEKIRKALNLFRGTHNFKGFAKLDPGEEKNTVINIEEVDLKVEGPLIEIRIKAPYFLRYMVRRIVGAVVNFSTGKIGKADIENYLNGSKCPYNAPPRGLFLEKVYL